MRLGLSALLVLSITCACAEEPIDEAPGTKQSELSAAARRGRDVWFNNTYGGEKFFAFLAAHPDPSKRIRIAFVEVVNTPRHERFNQWGVINDPDCTANPAGGADICADPTATGVVGIRKFPGPGGSTLYGATCASCHAGFDPVNPPADPNHPTWDNIHPTIGNQYMKFGKIFSNNLAATDVRRLMFNAWPDGTVDTTALFNDNIMNPGVVTAFWEHKHRPTFDVGMDDEKPRNGQGGEDDVGGDLAALRVYTNIGVCFAECVAPRPDRPDPGAPIDIDQCRADCPDFPPEDDIEDLVKFLRTVDAPKYPDIPWDAPKYVQGRAVFDANCASCHDRSGERHHVITDDEITLPLGDPQVTNECRARTTNWDAGKLWAQFSSDVYKTRGFKGYRTMPLAGIWATAPFMHNQSIGTWAPADADPFERGDVFETSMQELLSASRPPKVYTTPVPVGPFPAGTPLTFIFSRNPATGALLCADAVENRGHTFGSDLSAADKDRLIYWLKHQ